MRHYLRNENEKGMTLVEVLAALVILGIIFIGFMTILPQMSIFNEKTENKLETMNLAKRELASIHKIKDLEKKTSELNGTVTNIEELAIKRYEYPLEKEYVCMIDFYTDKVLDGKEHGDTLRKITIKVMKDDKIISETFGYINE